jgi:hypothetical protein
MVAGSCDLVSPDNQPAIIQDAKPMTSSMNKWPDYLRIAGIVLLLAGIQAWGFHKQTSPLITEAQQQLSLLQRDVPESRLINLSMQSLKAYWDINSDELTRRQILELRDFVLREFATDPKTAVQQLVQVVASFESQAVDDQEALLSLRRQISQLERMYTDHYERAILALTNPAWYLQPTAAFLNNNTAQLEALAFNRSLYLMHVHDANTAIDILDDLRSNTADESLRAKALFTLARIRYQAFRIEKNPSYFQDALQLAQQSVRSDADHELAKLFLDYLLSVDRRSVEVDTSPLEGEGSGEGEGERGAISSDRGEF